MGQKFLGSKPNSIWRKIYENHMMDESFMENFQAILQYLRDGNKVSTVYHSVETMLYFSKQCELKILWTSSERKQLSFGFPKGSPLLPFFQYAYKKLRQTGTLNRIQEKWHKNEKSTKCGLKPMNSISIKKTGLVIVLFFGVFLQL